MDGPISQRRWWRSRKFIFLAVLVAAAGSAYWVLPWLLMPEDMKRMFGEWKLVRVQAMDNGQLEEVDTDEIGGQRFTILPHRIRTPGREALWFHLEPAEHKLTLFDSSENEYGFLGFKVTLPIWLRRPSEQIAGQYELEDRRLMLLLRPDERDDGNGGHWQKLYLERAP